MDHPNVKFEKMLSAVTAYCMLLREAGSTPKAAHELRRAAHKLTTVFKQTLTALANTAAFNDDDPDLVYAERIVHFGVSGLSKKIFAKFWKYYFTSSLSAIDAAKKMGISRSSIYRLEKVFPRKVSNKLWLKNQELTAPKERATVSPKTLEAKRKEILQEAFDLTDRQADVLLLHCYSLRGPHLTRREIAKRLYITANTLKSHIRRIIRKLDVDTMTNAAAKAVGVLRKHLDAEREDGRSKPAAVKAHPPVAVNIFFSYAHKDEELKDRLETNLSMMKREGLLKSWSDRQINPGEEFDNVIDKHINDAHVILFLVSPDFIDSDYIWNIEMTRALERHEAREAHVIPVILRPSDWKSAPFGKLLVLPTDGKAVTLWTNEDAAFLDISKGIRKVVKKILNS